MFRLVYSYGLPRLLRSGAGRQEGSKGGWRDLDHHGLTACARSVPVTSLTGMGMVAVPRCSGCPSPSIFLSHLTSISLTLCPPSSLALLSLALAQLQSGRSLLPLSAAQVVHSLLFPHRHRIFISFHRLSKRRSQHTPFPRLLSSLQCPADLPPALISPTVGML